MARTRSVDFDSRRTQILEGALEVFSTKGFRDATNKDIASAAGIGSPGLIYHYFKDKAALLRAVIEHNTRSFEAFSLDDALHGFSVADGLRLFAHNYLALVRRHNFRLMLREALGDSDFARTLSEAGPLRLWGVLATYLQHHMQRGHLRPCDPALAARSFVGPIVIHLMERNVFNAGATLASDEEALVDHIVDTFMRGMRP
jgi:AcrR family transcriptional regulator